MARPHDRPAVLAALGSGIVVMLLPIVVVYGTWLFAPSYSNSGTTVVGIDPDRARVATQQLRLVTAYVIAYGGIAAILGLVVGAIVWLTAAFILMVYARRTVTT